MTVTDRRRMIVEAAKQAFTQFGYKATTMGLVSRVAQVGKGTIYTFFSTKEELFDEILHDVLEEMNQVFAAETGQNDSFDNKIFRMLDMLIAYRAEHELFVKLAQESRVFGTKKALEGIERLENAVLDLVKDQIDQAVRQGEIAPCDARVAAYILLRMYIAFTAEWDDRHGSMTDEEVKGYMYKLMFAGLLKMNSAKG